MTEIDTTGEPVEQDRPTPPGLDVQLAHELIEKGRRARVSLVGPDGLLACEVQVGPGSLTSGDRWTDMIAMCR